MIYIVQNALAILVAGAVAFGINILWPPGREAKPGLAGAIITFAAVTWMAAILAGALILAPVEAGVWTVTLGSAFIIWIGFVLPVVAVTGVGDGKRAGGTIGRALQWLVIMLVQAALMRLIGLTPPTG